MRQFFAAPVAIILAMALSPVQAQSPTAASDQSCSAAELELLAAYLERDLAAQGATMRALRAESILEHPEKREALLAGAVSFPAARLVGDALAADAMQYRETCQTPHLDAAKQAIDKAAFEEIFRVNRILEPRG